MREIRRVGKSEKLRLAPNVERFVGEKDERIVIRMITDVRMGWMRSDKGESALKKGEKRVMITVPVTREECQETSEVLMRKE